MASKVFISYAGAEPIGDLARALEGAGFQPFTAYDLPVGSPLAEALLDQIRGAQLAVFVINDQRQALNSSVELGIATAAGLPVLIVASPEAELPDIAGRLPVLRLRPDDPRALDRVLAAVGEVASAATPSALRDEAKPLHNQALQLLNAWTALLEEKPAEGMASPAQDQTEAHAQWILADVFRSAGIRAIREPREGGAEADFVVWDRDLEPFIGAPLLVEVVGGRWSDRRLSLKVRQLSEYLSQLPSSRWALLVLAGASSEMPDLEIEHEPVLVISLGELLSRLQGESFVDIVRMLRNERVHS